MYKKICSLFLILVISFSFIGCNKIENLKVNLGLKNKDFEFMKSDTIKEVVIQSNRDKGFRFVVTNEEVIKEAYSILTSGKKVKMKSKLDPDYIFEVHERGGKIRKFYYIAGLDKQDGGNLYSEDGKNIYVVSSRLDNDILGDFENIRKPRKFKDVYYESILQCIKKFFKDDENAKLTDKEFAISIKDDFDVQKFLLSLDIEEFKSDLEEDYPNIKIKDDTLKSDFTIQVQTEGYKSIVYKSIIRFIDNKTNKKKSYYIWSTYENKNWTIKIEEKKPQGF